MAAAEKMCEFEENGFYGYEMYEFKRNHIQIHPSHRKKFKGSRCVLTIRPREKVIAYKKFGWSSYEKGHYVPSGARVTMDYEFLFVTDNPLLQGCVKGHYWNSTRELGKTIRKLKRMVGGSKYLTIVREYKK